MSALFETPSSWSVQELNESIKHLIETQTGVVAVQGEVANVAKPRSGHWYFTLKDDHAQVRCVWFAGARLSAPRILLEHGAHLVIQARATLYPARGDYQLVVSSANDQGEGRLHQAFLHLKTTLEAQGWFAPERKRPLPKMPQHLGLITSPTGAALQDMLRTLRQRYPLAQVTLFGSAVQGAQAVPELLRALHAAQRSSCDVLVVARGGGSLEDLWAFNEIEWLEALRACSLPVVVGIGHETDVTLTDALADVSAPTPTGAVVSATPDVGHLMEQVHAQQRSTRMRLQRLLNQKQHAWHQHHMRLIHNRPPLERLKHRLSVCLQNMHHHSMRHLARAQERLNACIHTLHERNPNTCWDQGYVRISSPNNTPVRLWEEAKSYSFLLLHFKDATIKVRLVEE